MRGTFQVFDVTLTPRFSRLLGRVYPQLPPDVVPAAKRGLQLQLDKLVNEGRVRALEDDRYAVCQGKL